jgi:hypothetical protein
MLSGPVQRTAATLLLGLAGLWTLGWGQLGVLCICDCFANPEASWGFGALEMVSFLWKINCGTQAGVLCPSNAIQASSKLKQRFGNPGEMGCRRLRVLTSSVELRNVWTSAPELFLV